MTTIDQFKSAASLKLGFARSNQFLVQLPTNLGGKPGLTGFAGILSKIGSLLGGEDMNILCSQAQLPGKRILTHERNVGAENQQVAYGYVVDQVSLTFYCMNDYGIVKYFDEWRDMTIQQIPGEAMYKKDYAKPIKIHQLRRPLAGKSISAGPIRLNLGLGGSSVYSVELLDAFPTTVSAIELTNELDGLVQLTVGISYTNWINTEGGQGWISASAGLGSFGL
tara:strand:- start:8797 stop:9465 length:669 start_codon:yes stop_codon:yes gene_type:complete